MFSTSRGLLKVILLNLITFGIYGLILMSHISEEINIIASPKDNKHTMHYLLIVFIFSWLTLGIAPLVWMHRLCNRIGNELKTIGSDYKFGASDYWIWGILGGLIIVGPFIFLHMLLKSMNIINANYIRAIQK